MPYNYNCIQEQYAGFTLILRKALALLCALARGNTIVQQRLFDRLDELLEVQSVEDELACALIEVCTCGHIHVITMISVDLCMIGM